MYILGVNAGPAASHDPAACLTDADGTVLAYVEEERLSRVRHAPAQQPVRAVRRCLDLAGVSPGQVTAVATGWDVPRMAERAGTGWGPAAAADFLAALGLDRSAGPDLVFVPHHRAHAVSAFGASPYQEAAVLVVDGNGEEESISVFRARRGEPPQLLRSWPRVHSLGYLYEEASKWLGFSRLHAGKTMGLAAYGRELDCPAPEWIVPDGDDLRSLLGTDPRLDYAELRAGWRAEIARYAGRPGAGTPLDDLAEDPQAVRVAVAAQRTVECCMRWLAALARSLAGTNALCLAGGVALNCAANGRLGGAIYAPPVPHDAGVALGAAWAVAAPADGDAFTPYAGSHPELPPPGPADLAGFGVVMPLDADAVLDLLAAGRVGGICRGRSEVGPRALCHRSLLASPTAAGMARRVNTLKGRERWRPFGPVAGGPTDYWLPVGELERYMLGAAAVSEAGSRAVPAVTHADRTTRPQRLGPQDEPFVFELLHRLEASGEPPVLLNTSFNGPGEPLVDSAADAVDCARRLGLDFLVIDDWLVVPKQAGPAPA